MLDSDRVALILESADKLTYQAVPAGRASLEDDEYAFMFARGHLQNVGESAPRLSAQFLRRHPEIKHEKLHGMRHSLVHEYHVVDFDLMWTLMTEDVPALATALRAALRDDPGIR